MSKKNWYWIIAILVAVICIALIVYASNAKSSPQTPSSSAVDHSSMDHGDMDHGQASVSDPNLSAYLEEQNANMATMMNDMESVQLSGNAAVDFLAGMIPHHEAAIAMSESYLNHGGSHSVLAPLAKDIITAQEAEITQMQEMLAKLRESGSGDKEQAEAYMKAYHEMMDHSMAHNSADSLDAAFAEGMIMHHQMAVDMANAILPHTGEEDVKKLAQTIVDAQEKEISQMQSVLNENTQSAR